MRQFAILTFGFLAAACAAGPQPMVEQAPPQPIEIQLLAINDFHGNLETPAAFTIVEDDGSTNRIISGGAAHLAAALEAHRVANTVTVSAGDTIGATPLTSALFLDEPTIEAMNRIRLEFNAVGNHEFDKGRQELLRIQHGGCEQYTLRTPCAVEPFGGADFQYLAANVKTEDGTTLLPATGLKTFGSGDDSVTIGFIGMTLRETQRLVTPAGVQGLTFADEIETANALVPGLKAAGADTIVLLIHEGGREPSFGRGNDCKDLTGHIQPIIEALDPAIKTIVSGHSHWAYVCQNGEGGTQDGQLLTSAGKNGYFFTDIRLNFDPATKALTGQQARNITVGNGEFGEDADLKAYVDRYVAAAAPLANRVVGHLTAPAPRDEFEFESPASNLIADSMLAATMAPDKGGAQIAFVNATGVRVSIAQGDLLYRDVFSMMPFGNNLVVVSLTGAQIKQAIEQQFAVLLRKNAPRPQVLATSVGFRYSYDLTKPVGERASNLVWHGKPLDMDATYRVALNNYLASGGDGISAFAEGTDIVDPGIVDIDAFIAWVADGRDPPKANRITAANGN